jgi:superfamily II DNA or RNA helicase
MNRSSRGSRILVETREESVSKRSETKKKRDPRPRVWCGVSEGFERPSLHPYQRDAIEALGRWTEDPSEQKGVLCLPTGSGKTRTAVYFALDRWVQKRRKVLWLCHRTELMEQAVEAFQKLKAAAGRSFVVGRFGNKGEGQIDEPVDVVVAKVPSLARGNDQTSRLARLWNEQGGFALVVVDEAHHAVASTWKRLLGEARELDATVRILGLTATPTRAIDGERPMLVRQVGRVLFEQSAGALIEEEYLARPMLHTVNTELSFEASPDAVEEYERFGDIPKSLAKEISSSAARNAVALSFFERGPFGRGYGKWGKTLVFAQNRIQAESLAKEISDRCDLNVREVYGDTDVERRGEIVRGFSGDGTIEVDVVVNVGVFTEGTDLKGVETVLLARPTRSPVLFAQMIGRGMRGRKNSGTPGCHIIVLQDEIKVGDVFATSYGWEQEQLGLLGLTSEAREVEQVPAEPERVPAGAQPPIDVRAAMTALVEGWLARGAVGPTATSAKLRGRWVIEAGDERAELPIFEGEDWLHAAVQRVAEVRALGPSDPWPIRALESARELVHVTPRCLEHFVVVLGRTTRAPEFVPFLDAIEGGAGPESTPQLVEGEEGPGEPAEPVAVEASAVTEADDGTSERVRRLVGLWKRAAMIEATAEARQLVGVWVAPADEAAVFPVFEGEKASVVSDLEDVRRIRIQGGVDQSALAFLKERTPAFVTRACLHWYVRALRSTRNIPAFLGREVLGTPSRGPRTRNAFPCSSTTWSAPRSRRCRSPSRFLPSACRRQSRRRRREMTGRASTFGRWWAAGGGLASSRGRRRRGSSWVCGSFSRPNTRRTFQSSGGRAPPS